MTALQPAGPRDLLAFAITSRSIRVRPATASEKATAGIAGVEAKAVLMQLCRGKVLKAIVASRPLKHDVTEAAAMLARAANRPLREAQDAAAHLPLIPGEALSEITARMLGDLPGCRRCICAARYAPLAAGLAEAAAEAIGQAEVVASIEHQVDAFTAIHGPVEVTADHRAAGDIVRSIIAAAPEF